MLTRALTLLVVTFGLPFGAAAVSVCTVTSVGVAFGAIAGVSSSATDSAGTIRVRCIALTPDSVHAQIHLSTGTSLSYTSRILLSGLNGLNYNLYTDPLRQIVWGDGTGGTSYQAFSASLPVGETVKDFLVYSRIPAGQRPRPGVYADALLITVLY